MSGLAPKLRFPEFKDGWQNNLLGDVAKFSKGKGISKSDIIENGKTPCIRYGELYTTYNTSIEDVISFTNIDKNSLIISKGNEVIVPASGEDAKDIATASVVKISGVALGGDINIINSKHDGYFLASYLSGKKRTSLAALAQGNSVVHLYSSQLACLPIHFPPLPEQKKIADFLSSVDAKIDAVKRKLSAVERYKKGLMQQIFSQKIRFKQDDGSDFLEWEEMPFGQAVTRGTRDRERHNRPNMWVIDLEHMESETGRILSKSVFKNSLSQKTVFSSGDVLFGKLRPYLKKFARPDFDGVCSSEIWVLSGLNVLNAYLFYLVQTSYFIQLANISSGSKMPRSDWGTIADSDFSFPSLPEQQKIADFLSSVDAKIHATKTQIEKLETFKKGLLQQMFV